MALENVFANFDSITSHRLVFGEKRVKVTGLGSIQPFTGVCVGGSLRGDKIERR